MRDPEEAAVTRTTPAPLLVVLALALVGCGPTPTPGESPPPPRPTATSTPTPTSTPMPGETETDGPHEVPLDEVTWMIVLSDFVYFCDDIACAVDGFNYEVDSPEATAEKLAAVFGVAPTVERPDPASVSYVWSGFRLFWTADAGMVGRRLGVSIDAATVHGIRILTAHEVAVGTPLSTAATLADRVTTEYGEYELRFDTEPAGPATEYFVGVYGAADGSGPATTITAPIWASIP